MEQKTKSSFNLFLAQKRGMTGASHAVDYIIGALIVVLLVSVLASTIFGYLGTGSTGLGNTTANPAVPTWLPPVLIVGVGIGLLYLVFRALDLVK